MSIEVEALPAFMTEGDKMAATRTKMTKVLQNTTMEMNMSRRKKQKIHIHQAWATKTIWAGNITMRYVPTFLVSVRSP